MSQFSPEINTNKDKLIEEFTDRLAEIFLEQIQEAKDKRRKGRKINKLTSKKYEK